MRRCPLATAAQLTPDAQAGASPNLTPNPSITELAPCPYRACLFRDARAGMVLSFVLFWLNLSHRTLFNQPKLARISSAEQTAGGEEVSVLTRGRALPPCACHGHRGQGHLFT